MKALLRAIVRILFRNALLVLFPEGRITRNKGLMKIYDGVGFVALKTGAII